MQKNTSSSFFSSRQLPCVTTFVLSLPFAKCCRLTLSSAPSPTSTSQAREKERGASLPPSLLLHPREGCLQPQHRPSPSCGHAGGSQTPRGSRWCCQLSTAAPLQPRASAAVLYPPALERQEGRPEEDRRPLPSSRIRLRLCHVVALLTTTPHRLFFPLLLFFPTLGS